MCPRQGGVQVSFCCLYKFLLSLQGRLCRLQISFGLHTLLIGRNARLGQFNHPPAVACSAVERGACLLELRLCRCKLGLRVNHIA